MKDYRFRVTRHEEWDDDTFDLVETDLWDVYLPHQCDSWDIADGATREQAIAALQAFIAQAQVALAALEDATGDVAVTTTTTEGEQK